MTENGELAKSIAAVIAVPLKAAGFRKRANSFNRRARDGIVHTVSIQLGRYEAFGDPTASGLTTELWGRYTVELGAYVPSMGRMGAPRSDWVNVYNCQLRWRLDTLVPSGPDRWWDLRDRLSVEDVVSAVCDVGLPKLDSFPDSDSVLAAYAAEGHRAFGGVANRSVALDVGDLLIARGDREAAADLLRWYVDQIVADPRPHVHHQRYVREYLAERRMEHLAGPLAERAPRENPRR